MNLYTVLTKKIRNKSAVVGIVGIGYVGNAIADVVSQVGFKIIGFDIDQKKITNFNRRKTSRFFATFDQKLLAKCDIVMVCVPTPVTEEKIPDLTPLNQAATIIAKYISSGALIIIESSISPGTTRKLFQKYFSSKNVFAAHSPERIDIGNKKYSLANTPKIVAGIDEKSLELAHLFYQQFIKRVIPASSLETAELSKILENTFRLVNISLMHEIQRFSEKSGISLWEVIALCTTKPFGFMPHYPGPGVGGHCIPVDPYYLLQEATDINIDLPIVRQALLTNENRADVVVNKILNLCHKNVKNSKVLLIGITYKPDVADIRESAGIKILKKLEQKKIAVFYHDPLIPSFNKFISTPLTDLSRYDLIVIVSNHTTIDYSKIQKQAKLILDTRNVYKTPVKNVILL